MQRRATNFGEYFEATSRQPNKGAMKFYYVYILQSEIDQKRFYTGFTEDLDSRLKSHNTVGCGHTSKYKPWRVKTAFAFDNRQKAINFEEYLKSPSGRAFAKKRL